MLPLLLLSLLLLLLLLLMMLAQLLPLAAICKEVSAYGVTGASLHASGPVCLSLSPRLASVLFLYLRLSFCLLLSLPRVFFSPSASVGSLMSLLSICRCLCSSIFTLLSASASFSLCLSLSLLCVYLPVSTLPFVSLSLVGCLCLLLSCLGLCPFLCLSLYLFSCLSK